MKTKAYDCDEHKWRNDYIVTPDGAIHKIIAISSDEYTASGYALTAISFEPVCWKLARATGLHDKYRNEIYEHDIVKITARGNDHHQRGAWEIRTVKYFMGNPCVCWKSQDTGPALYPLIVDHDIEIIGNVFENPELIEM